jgi:hypothetical protein
MAGAMGAVTTRGAVIGMLMAGHDGIVVTAVAVVVVIAATGVSARTDAAVVVVAVVGAAEIGTWIGGRAAISLPRTHKAAVEARARDAAKARRGAMGIAASPAGATEIVTTSTARAIAQKVVVVRASAPTAIVGMETAVREIAPRAAVVTAIAVREVALKVVVATAIAVKEVALRATAARAVETSIAMPIAQVTSTVAAAMLANPVRLSVRTSKLINPSIRRRRWRAARVMPA